MQYLYHILFAAAYAASIAFIAFPRVLPLPALAKPITRSSSSQTVTVHHISRRPVRAPKSKDSKITVAASDSFIDSSSNTSLYPRSHSIHADPGVYAGVQSRSGDVNVNTVLDQISILSSWHSKARTNAQNLSTLSYLFLSSENAKNIYPQRPILKRRNQDRMAHPNINGNVLLSSQPSILTLVASRRHSAS
jgi:hypothetical protein